MTAHRSAAPLTAWPSLALAQARIADLRSAAEHAQRVRVARGPRWTVSWRTSALAALRNSLAALPASRSAARRQPCPTC